MKIEDIVILDKSIVLGIFSTSNFYYFKTLSDEYPFHKTIGNNRYMLIEGGIIDIVEYTCKIANQIIFILDNINFPINPNKSMTCQELYNICKCEEFFNKTVFVKGTNVINFDRNLVIN